jgi:serine/threonine-protein kinase
MHASEIKPGDQIAGRYRVEGVIGKGGMGVVVLATQLHLGEKVALKLLSAQAAADPMLVVRFVREAKAATRIKSEHVVRILDVAKLEDGLPYIAMEFLDGSDLKEVLDSGGPLAPDVAIDYVLQACEAIAEAHAVGIVHRDLKPANLFASKRADGSTLIKVLDFGISKFSVDKEKDSNMTGASALFGSPLYMSPEQLLGAREATLQSDVWALGVILYELLTNAVPFQGDDMPQICTRIMHGAPIPVQSLRPELPPSIVDAIAGCLEKDASRRFKSTGELALALAAVAPARSQLSIERITRIAGTSGPPPMRAPIPSIPVPGASSGALPATSSGALPATSSGAFPASAPSSPHAIDARGKGAGTHTGHVVDLLPKSPAALGALAVGVVVALGVCVAVAVLVLVRVRKGDDEAATPLPTIALPQETAPSPVTVVPSASASTSTSADAPATAPSSSSVATATQRRTNRPPPAPTTTLKFGGRE